MIEKFDANEYKKQLAAAENIQTCPKVPLPEVDENQNYIFISYSHKDYKKVYADLADMYEAGVRFWYDKGLSAGKNWDEEVQEKLLNIHCVGVIFFMSKNLFLSKSANREIEIVCNLSSDNKENAAGILNYFSVNLTDKLPVEILSQTMQEAAANALDMSMIGVLSRAFPDNATYLYCDSLDHTTELISQIKNQFGVISDQSSAVTIYQDTDACSVFIGTLYESISAPGREKLLDQLLKALKNASIPAYIMKEYNGYISGDTDLAIKKHIERQNEIKYNDAQCLIIVCCNSIGWKMTATQFGEFDPEAKRTKKIFYLIAGSEYGDSLKYMPKSFEPLLADERYRDLASRTFYKKDSEEKLIEALLDTLNAV